MPRGTDRSSISARLPQAPQSGCAERFAQQGVQYVDAGISGGAAAAEKGTLTLMVGGEADAVQALEWAFAPIAAKVAHMGGSGAGHTTKLLNNFLNAVSLAATAEVMVAGKKAGLDLHRLLDVLNSSSGVNFATQNRFPKIVDGDYLEGGLTGKLMTKDVVLYVDRVRELGVVVAQCVGAAGELRSRHGARLWRPRSATAWSMRSATYRAACGCSTDERKGS